MAIVQKPDAVFSYGVRFALFLLSDRLCQPAAWQRVLLSLRQKIDRKKCPCTAGMDEKDIAVVL